MSISILIIFTDVINYTPTNASDFYWFINEHGILDFKSFIPKYKRIHMKNL